MDTRVTMQTMVQNGLTDTRRLTDQLDSLQTQAATGKKFQNISDDPATALAVLGYNVQAQNYGTYLGNIDTATSKLNASVSTLQQVNTLLSQAQAVAIQGANSGNDTTSFAALAQSVDSMISQMLSLANTQQQDGTYVFAGTATQTQPFTVSQTNAQGQPLAVQYNGAANASNMFVDRAQQVAIDYAGAQIFQGQQRQPTVFTGSTGAGPGSGTDSATGRSQLTISHTGTTFAAGSGVQPGSSSAAGDTILGPAGAHTLQITDTSGNGSAGTVSLDGGPPVAFTNSDTNLNVSNASGASVYLDMSAITPNFNGNVDVTSNGAMSIDGGATSVPLTFAADQTVTDGTTGAATNVNTTNVLRTGNEAITYPGTADVFQSLINLRDDLRNTGNLSQNDQINAISGDLADLQRSSANVLATVGSQSATLQSMQSLQSHLQNLQLNAKTTSSNLGDADISDLVIQLQSYQNMLQLSYATFSRVTSQSLLDFLK